MQKLKLTLKQFAEIKTMIKSRCCNCYQGNCLLLDDGDSHTCPQLITPSHIICRYFIDCVLPSDKALLKSITGQTPAETIVCALCGSKTERTGRNQKFCPECAKKKQRQRMKTDRSKIIRAMILGTRLVEGTKAMALKLRQGIQPLMKCSIYGKP